VGREPVVSVVAPDGFEVGDARFPPPQRYEFPDSRIGYGYRDHAAVFVEIRPPERLSTTKAYRFDVKADWVACKAQCVREDMNAFFELAASPAGGKSAGDEELESMLATVPRPFDVLEKAHHEWLKRSHEPTVVLTAKKASFIEFIPANEGLRKVVKAKIPANKAMLELAFESPPGEPPYRIEGLVGVEVAGKAAYFDVEIPWANDKKR
jgi:DsbC/DsbD-like thiol-disulfide interchange protein